MTIRRYSATGHLQDTYPLPGIDGISSIRMYTGDDYLLAAWRRGQPDIVSYNLPKDKYMPFTNDRWDDGQPMLLPGANSLLFTSERQLTRSRKKERLTDTVVMVHGIFTAVDKIIAPWLTDTLDYLRYENPVALSGGRVLITSTLRGTARPALISNIRSPVIFACFKPGNYPFQYLPQTDEIITYSGTRDSLFLRRQPLKIWIDRNRDTTTGIAPWLADYKTAAAARAREDSILKAARGDEPPSFLSGVLSGGSSSQRAAKQRDSIRKAQQFDGQRTEPYILQLYSAYFSAKVNNDYFINRYQPYKSYQGMFKFPEVGGIAQGGFSDLFENHHISIAFLLPAGSEGSDFFIKYGNNARKADWGLAYYRKTEDLKPDPLRRWVDENGRLYPNTAKVKSNYYELNVQYPLSYYSGVGLTTAIRQDKTVFLATEKYSLDFPAFKSLWSITTISYTINKLRPTLPLLYRGFSGNARVDGFKGFTQKEEALSGSSMNLSYHLPLYKYITLVAQLHAGASGGDSRVLYNLGGVDNNVSPRVDSSVHFRQDAPYAFQTLVTPFRGYYQNSLYGSNYCLFNADIYFPLFQSLIPVETPLSAINNLQLGVLADLAAAGGKGDYTTAAKGWQASYGLSARTTLAGYPLRFDLAWPGTFSKKPVWYLSLNLR